MAFTQMHWLVNAAEDNPTQTQAQGPVHVDNADEAETKGLNNEVIRLAHSLSDCKKTPKYKLTTVSANISDMNGFIRERRQILDQENDNSIKNGASDTARLAAANQQIQIMQSEMRTLFEEYKALGGTENVPSSVVMVPSPCKSIYSAFNSELGLLLKGNSKENPSFTKAKVLVDSCSKLDYPKISRSNGQTGTVQVSMLAYADGNVIYEYISKSSGYRLLDQTALDLAHNCKVDPFGDDRKPNLAWVAISYSFRLAN